MHSVCAIINGRRRSEKLTWFPAVAGRSPSWACRWDYRKKLWCHSLRLASLPFCLLLVSVSYLLSLRLVLSFSLFLFFSSSPLFRYAAPVFPLLLLFSSLHSPSLCFLLSYALPLSLFSPSFLSVSPLAFYSLRMHVFPWLLQEDCNGRHALWWWGISVVGHAPLIEAAPLLTSPLPFTVETVANEEGNEQLSRKRHRFNIQNEHSDLVIGCFCNFIIKPPW